MNRLWIKLHLEILDDPKMGRLSDRLWRRCVEFFLLAGKADGNTGRLPTVPEMAWALRADEQELVTELEALAKVGIVRLEGADWMVVNFEKRQKSESYERVKRFKARHSNGENNGDSNGKNNDDETPSSYSYSLSYSLSEEGGVGEGAAVYQKYEREFGALTPMITDAIEDACKTYPAEWVPEAMEIAVKANKRSWKYVEGILKNCKAMNIRPSLSAKEKSNGNNGTGNHKSTGKTETPVYTPADRAAAERIKKRRGSMPAV